MKPKANKKTPRRTIGEELVAERLIELITPPLLCPNCDDLVEAQQLFCSEGCQQQAKDL